MALIDNRNLAESLNLVTARSGQTLRIDGISRTFGDVKALDNLNLELGPGELVALLGPSGCGKTTALRIVAGLETADTGTILVGSDDITQRPPNKRDMGMVFQAYSLFPNLTAKDNIEYGLRVRKYDKARRAQRSAELLELVGLADKAKVYPHQLSGGQQQRVALARALAIEPTVLLLDEPLSALDAQVRTQIRDEIRRIQLRLGITTLFVTHDQEEAMAIADRVGIMRSGKLEQIDRPDVVYAKPATAFVASFVGTVNRVPTTLEAGTLQLFGRRVAAANELASHQAAGLVTALIRPESLSVVEAGGAGTLAATVVTRSFLGPMSRITLDVSGIGQVHADIPSPLVSQLRPGDLVGLALAANEVMIESTGAA